VSWLRKGFANMLGLSGLEADILKMVVNKIGLTAIFHYICVFKRTFI